MKTPNARFWIYWNGTYTKLTLRPGEQLELHSYGHHDEGYSATDETYEHAGTHVRCDRQERARDCDGRHEWHGEFTCGFDKLRINEGHPDYEESRGLMLPEWERGSAGQWDQFAELMNY